MPIAFNKCEYIISTTNRTQSPNVDNLPEFVFLGRSNVGKSSFINALTKRKALAKTSGKPGKTRTMNYFNIDDRFYLVDAPGYGYASRSYGSRLDFGDYIEDYLNNNPNLKITFLLVDTFVGPTKDDILMYEYLKYHNLKVKIIGTKMDKVGKSKILSYKKIIKEKLNAKNEDIYLTSSEEKKGFDEINVLMSTYLE